MTDTYGQGNFGDGLYQPPVDNGYGYALYGTGVFGTVTIRIDGSAAITTSTSVSADGGYAIGGSAAVTSSTAVSAGATGGVIVMDGSAAITTVSTVVCTIEGSIRTAAAAATSSTAVSASIQPKISGNAAVTSVSTVACLGAYTPLIETGTNNTVTTVACTAELKWNDVVDPSTTWSQLTPPSTSWTEINSPYR